MSINLDRSGAYGGGKTVTAKPLQLGGSSGGNFHFGGGTYTPEEEDDSKVKIAAIVAAVVFHLVLLWVSFPQRDLEPRQIASSRSAYVVQAVRFKPPPPKAQQAKQVTKPKTKKIPFPDPTPDDPEPILEEEVQIDIPEIDSVEIGDGFEIPEGPSGPTGQGPMWIEGEVQPPEKVFAPQPRYTEEARKARVQGVVILQAVIDSLGNVTEVEVVKGLPEGLDQSAVDTVRTWKYRPAVHEGQPVAVYMNLTISFSLQ